MLPAVIFHSFPGSVLRDGRTHVRLCGVILASCCGSGNPTRTGRCGVSCASGHAPPGVTPPRWRVLSSRHFSSSRLSWSDRRFSGYSVFLLEKSNSSGRASATAHAASISEEILMAVPRYTKSWISHISVLHRHAGGSIHIAEVVGYRTSFAGNSTRFLDQLQQLRTFSCIFPSASGHALPGTCDESYVLVSEWPRASHSSSPVGGMSGHVLNSPVVLGCACWWLSLVWLGAGAFGGCAPGAGLWGCVCFVSLCEGADPKGADLRIMYFIRQPSPAGPADWSR